jgi:hypothetical protein
LVELADAIKNTYLRKSVLSVLRQSNCAAISSCSIDHTFSQHDATVKKWQLPEKQGKFLTRRVAARYGRIRVYLPEKNRRNSYRFIAVQPPVQSVSIDFFLISTPFSDALP